MINKHNMYIYIFSVYARMQGIFLALESLDLQYSMLFYNNTIYIIYKYIIFIYLITIVINGRNKNNEREHITDCVICFKFRVELTFLNCQNG